MSNLKTQLQELLYGLWELAQDDAQLLIYLSHIVAPLLAEDRRIPLLTEMISRANDVLAKPNISSHHLDELITNGQVVLSGPEPGYLETDQGLRLFFEFQPLKRLLRQISESQLLLLTNNVLPPGPLTERLEFLQKIQEVFQGWTVDTLHTYHDALAGSPLHMERQVLLQLEPHLPWEILHLVIDLLKLPRDELIAFHGWLTKMPPEQLLVLLQLLQIEAPKLFSLKHKISPSPQAVSTSAAATPPPTHPGKSALSKSSEALAAMIAESTGLTPPASPSVAANDLSSPLDMDITTLLGISTSSVLHIETPSLSLPEPPQIPAIASVPPVPTPTSVPPHNYGVRGGFAAHATTPVLIAPAPPPVQTIAPSAIAGTVPPATAIEPASLQLRIARQPPPRTVYQRILKPFPAVMLSAGNATVPPTGGPAPNNLFVECALVRSDADIELPTCLEGNRIERVTPGSFATFKKLKILSTSQQQGTLFRLRFVLKRYSGAAFEVMAGSAVFSQPIEVFSHTLYLTERTSSGGLSTSTGSAMAATAGAAGLSATHPPPPPVVMEVLPPAGPASGGTRAVVLGSNFVQSPLLRVKFGTVEVGATFHESGTLIVATPPYAAASMGPVTVPVRVANDGVHFCETQATFTFT